MEINRLTPSSGIRWIIQGYRLFRRNPVVWSLMTTAYFILVIASNLIPVVGQILMALLLPVFSVGFMVGAKSLYEGGSLNPGHLFIGFKSNLQPLITLGGIYLAATILIIGLSSVIDDGVLMKVMLFAEKVEPTSLQDPQTKIAMLFVLALHILLFATYWFAPPLILFKNVGAPQSLMISLIATLKNIMPLLIYGLVLGLLSLVLMLFVGALADLLSLKPETAMSIVVLISISIVMPLIFTSCYISYRDIFE